jgi:MYXO-CTERM domain-containing protein
MPAPAGFENNQTDDTVGTSGQGTRTNENRNDADRRDLPDTASPLPLIALGGLAALGGAAALRRSRR